MRLDNIGLVLAFLVAAGQVSGFAPASHFVSIGASFPLAPVVSPQVHEIRADVALAGQQKKKGKKKKKAKEPIAAPYTVAQGTRKAKEQQTVLQSVVEPTREAAAALMVETVSVAGISKVEIEAERLARESKEHAAKVRQETISRALLEARLARESQERSRATALQARRRTEADVMGLLQFRLKLEAAQRQQAAKQKQHALALQSRRRTEADVMGLLQSRLKLEAAQRQQAAKQKLHALALQSRRRTEADVLGLMQSRFKQEAAERFQARNRKQVETNRALFATRLVLEANSKKYKAKVQKELQQRALLVERLDREERIREEVRIREEKIAARKAAIQEARKQPKAPEVERMLQETYAAIDDLGERAYTMLVKLGIIEPSADPDDPDYDDSFDHELVYDFGY